MSIDSYLGSKRLCQNEHVTWYSAIWPVYNAPKKRDNTLLFEVNLNIINLLMFHSPEAYFKRQVKFY